MSKHFTETYRFWLIFALICIIFFIPIFYYYNIERVNVSDRRSWIGVTIDEVGADVSLQNKYGSEQTWCFDYDDTLMFTSNAFEEWRRLDTNNSNNNNNKNNNNNNDVNNNYNNNHSSKNNITRNDNNNNSSNSSNNNNNNNSIDNIEKYERSNGNYDNVTEESTDGTSTQDGVATTNMWDFVNNHGIRNNIPKSTIKLLQRMLELNDVRIVIITSRCSSSVNRLRNDSRSIAESLLRVMNINSNRVHGIFDLHEHDTLVRLVKQPSSPSSVVTSSCFNDLIVTMSCEKLGQRDKIKSIARYKCNRMFGDSDEDIVACLLGNNYCVPYRVLRSPKSTYRGAYNVNLYHEHVIMDSMN